MKIVKKILYILRSLDKGVPVLSDIEVVYGGGKIVGYKFEVRAKKSKAELKIIPGKKSG